MLNKHLKTTLLFLILILCSFSTKAQDIAALEQDFEKALQENEQEKAGQIAIKIADEYLALPHTQRDYRKVIRYYNEAIRLGKATGNSALEAKGFLKLGKHYGGIPASLNQGISNYNKGIEVVEAQRDWRTYTRATAELSNLYAKSPSTLGLAIRALQSSEKAAKEYNIDIDIQDYYQRYINLYKKKGDSRSVALYQRRLRGTPTRRPAPASVVSSTPATNEDLLEIETQLQEAREREEELNAQLRSLASSRNENQEKIENLQQEKKLAEEAKYLYEEKLRVGQEQIERQQQDQKNIIAATTVVFAFLIIVLILLLRQRKVNRKLAAKNAEILYQKQEIESQKHEMEKQSKTLEQEQEKSEKLLLNILPEATAKELKEKGFASPKSYDMVTVMFTDFKGFTNIAEQLSPVEIVRELDICFLKFDDIVARHNMEKIKTIGDAYMCAGGIPIENSSNPVDAVKAGLAMQEFMLQRREEKLRRREVPFELRIGIHTGHVVAGVVGKRKFAYDIWGDAVNIAARMESSGEVGRVNISEVTYERVKDHFYCNYRGKIKAKNKGEIDMYFVNGPL